MEWSAKVESAPCMREWMLPVILRARMLNVSPAYAGVEVPHAHRSGTMHSRPCVCGSRGASGPSAAQM